MKTGTDRTVAVRAESEEPEQETQDLVASAQAGDKRAFEKLLAEHYRFIFRAAYRWVGHHSDAEDITQTVCMRLGSVIGGFDGRSAFTSWLYRITLNAAHDHLRAAKRNTRKADALAETTDMSSPAMQESDIAVEDIWRAVRNLPDKQRDAVLLVFGEELSHAQAAEVMGCKEVTVSWHIHQARKLLRDSL